MANVSILKDASEIVHYNEPDIPFYLQHNYLSTYEDMACLCHWHEDIEYISPQNGHMVYNINGIDIPLEEGDGILVNSRQMHYGHSKDMTDCRFYCLVFRTALFLINPVLINRYVTPITTHPTIAYTYLHQSNPEEKAIIDLFCRLDQIYQKRANGFELLINSCFNEIWMRWYHLLSPLIIQQNDIFDENIDIQRIMMQYIYQNYSQKVTLPDIAAAGNVCRSKCCQIFKKYLNHTPIDFLNTYRLEISLTLLRETPQPVTEIALLCGFNSASYFSELFMQYKGCSPTEYRTRQHQLSELLLEEKKNMGSTG